MNEPLASTPALPGLVSAGAGPGRPAAPLGRGSNRWTAPSRSGARWTWSN